MKLSIVVPAYNEAAGIGTFHASHLMPVLSKMDMPYEVIYVNDGSTDHTGEILRGIAAHDRHVRVVSFSRNFGKEAAVTAGIAEAGGQAIIIMDADGQHPPTLIPDFVAKWQQGAQVVVGIWRTQAHESMAKKWGSAVFNRFFSKVAATNIPPNSTDYRLIDAHVRREFLRLNERNRITRGLIDWLGFKRDYVYFDAPARIAGQATYSTGKLVGLAVHSLVSLSMKPLYFLSWVGAAVTLTSFALGIFLFFEQFVMDDPLGLNFTGSALLGIFVSFLIGIVLTAQSVLALYLASIHDQVQGRPLYVIDPAHSFNIGAARHE